MDIAQKGGGGNLDHYRPPTDPRQPEEQYIFYGGLFTFSRLVGQGMNLVY